jgi:hypothetical protein
LRIFPPSYCPAPACRRAPHISCRSPSMPKGCGLSSVNIAERACAPGFRRRL